jgi:hypothetical protein
MSFRVLPTLGWFVDADATFGTGLRDIYYILGPVPKKAGPLQRPQRN